MSQALVRSCGQGAASRAGNVLVRLLGAVLVVLVVIGGAACVVNASELGTSDANTQLRTATLEGTSGHVMQYWGSDDLVAPNHSYRRLVVVIHGDQRNADDYYRYAAAAARKAGSDALVVAPRFPTEDDAAGELWWTEGGWKVGDPSVSDLPHVSSFAIVDAIVSVVAAMEPALKEVVIAGHSAGGQFVQRYAAGGERLPGLNYTFVVANPSSYMYFDQKRANGTDFERPPSDLRKDCHDYDQYKYGTEGLNEYMSARGGDALGKQFEESHVVVLLGALDSDDEASNLDTGCEAQLQGQNRLERGLIFQLHLIEHYGPEILETHRVVIIPGVEHSASRIFASEEGQRYLFGTQPGSASSRMHP